MEDFLLLVLHHCRSKSVEHEVQPCSQRSGGEGSQKANFKEAGCFCIPAKSRVVIVRNKPS